MTTVIRHRMWSFVFTTMTAQRANWQALHFSVVTVALLCTLVLCASGCAKSDVNTTASDWYSRAEPNKKIALVFVHGIFGDAKSTWTNADGTRFFDLIKKNSDVGESVDVFYFGFTSKMIGAGSLAIGEAANKMDDQLKFHNVKAYDKVVFVAHSMGGLVAMELLLTHREWLLKVPLLVLYSTPQEGSQISEIGRLFLNNPGLSQMIPADGNTYLQGLSNQWGGIVGSKPKIRCAYEKLETHGVLIVPWSSGTRFCEGTPAAVVANHEDIVKPRSASDDAVVVLVNAMREVVLETGRAKQLSAQIETPDFVKEADHELYVLLSPDRPGEARLINNTSSPVTYTVSQVSDARFLVIPLETPRTIAAGQVEKLQFILGYSGKPLNAEYQFALNVVPGNERRVVVRLKDPAQYGAIQTRHAEEIQSALASAMADPRTAWGIEHPGDGAASGKQRQASAEFVRKALMKQHGTELPEAAQWVLTADLLNGIKRPDVAEVALAKAEILSPASLKLDSVQRIASNTISLRNSSTPVQDTPFVAAMPPDPFSAAIRRLWDKDTKKIDVAKEVPSVSKGKNS
jgi:pimeloyl-ACP methyl ester carboxylesterase